MYIWKSLCFSQYVLLLLKSRCESWQHFLPCYSLLLVLTRSKSRQNNGITRSVHSKFDCIYVSMLLGGDETMLHPVHIVGMRRMAISDSPVSICWRIRWRSYPTTVVWRILGRLHPAAVDVVSQEYHIPRVLTLYTAETLHFLKVSDKNILYQLSDFLMSRHDVKLKDLGESLHGLNRFKIL